jgi:hypothetical protein
MIKIARKTATTLAAVASLALIFGMTACGASDSDCQGDPGRVVEKDYDSNGKAPDDWDVTVERDKDGTQYEKDVTSTAFDWVHKGSRWPSVKHCADGKVKD